MVDAAHGITLATFRRHVLDFDDFVRGMGYAVGRERGLHIADDWAVAFYRSTYRGRPCVFMDHSAIEYIWHDTPETEAINSERL